MSSRSYEVRCARCDVTFPIETKRCIHCGAATGPGRELSMRNPTFGAREASPNSANDGAFDTAYGIDGIEGLEDEEFVIRDESGNVSAGVGDAGDSAAEGSSPVKSLIKSMGGVIWILLLVGFSLARSCGGG